MSATIEVSRIVKTFGDVTAVDGVSFAVEAGESFGLLGPPGSGKSTLVRVLATLLPPTSGSASIDGADVVKAAGDVRRSIGVVLPAATGDRELTVAEHLRVFAMLHGVPRERQQARMAELIEAVGLTAHTHTPLKAVSTATRRRVDIARALVHQPRVLFLDEPTTGLDPASRAAIWAMLRTIQAGRGLTVVLGTPDGDEAAAVCNRVVRLEHGRIAGIGP